MKAVFLGTGTSHGVPMIGCSCFVCSSGDPRNHRRRTGLYVVANGMHLIFDTSPEFRLQAIDNRVERVDAVFLTHNHADHIFGFDDIRRYCALQGCCIPTYGSPETMADMRLKFDYAQKPSYAVNAVPRVDFIDLTEPVELGGVCITPLPVRHGQGLINAYRVDDGTRTLVYAPDCNGIPAETLTLIGQPDVMILDALRPKAHQTHFSTEESVAMLQQIGAKRSFVTHLTHDNEHTALQAALPDGIEVPYDGLAIQL
ncbi:MBL fold metallo-hydrolase [Verrucomicrobiota bacterium]